MSAFLVDYQLLRTIISWSDYHAIDFKDLNIDNKRLTKTENQVLFELFYQENINSLKYRYQDNYQDLIWWDLDRASYKYNYRVELSAHSKEIAIAILKMIECWRYQSCEHEYDESSTARLAMSLIESAAIEQLGYESKEEAWQDPWFKKVYNLAPWGYPDTEATWLDFLRSAKKLDLTLPKGITVWTYRTNDIDQRSEHKGDSVRRICPSLYGGVISDCTNNGVSKNQDRFVLVGKNIPKITQAQTVDEVLVLKQMDIGDRTHYYCVPWKCNRDRQSTMAGGNYVDSCDSRFRQATAGYPISVHDRIEK